MTKEEQEVYREIENLTVTYVRATENLVQALKSRWFMQGDFIYRWKPTIRNAYSAYLSGSPNFPVELPEGVTIDTEDGEDDTDGALRILRNLNDYLGHDIVWLALNDAIEGKEEFAFAYKELD